VPPPLAATALGALRLPGALGSLLAALALGYAGLLLLVYLLQDRLLYFPTRAIDATPADAGLAYEEVRLRAADGVELQAWFVPAADPRGTVLFFHGNAGNLSHRVPTLRFFHRLGYGTLLPSYRGYAGSGGSPSERGLYLDAEAAWRYLVEERGVPPAEVVLFGRSLGGAVAAWLATEHAPGALVLESTFTSVPELAAEHYPFLPVRLLARSHFPTERRLPGVRAPVLVVHSRADEVIPFHHSRRLWEAAPEPKSFLEISGGHNEGFLFTGAAYERGVAEFLERLEREEGRGKREE
jgi:uncharacterized protein